MIMAILVNLGILAGLGEFDKLQQVVAPGILDTVGEQDGPVGLERHAPRPGRG